MTTPSTTATATVPAPGRLPGQHEAWPRHQLRAGFPLVGQGPVWHCSCGWVFHDPQSAAQHSGAL